MKAYTNPADPRVIRALGYKDRLEGTWEFILEREGLCSRAGCECAAWLLQIITSINRTNGSHYFCEFFFNFQWD